MKTQLRQKFLLARKQGAEVKRQAQAHEQLCAHIAAWVKGQGFQDIFLYYPFRDEPNVLALIPLLPDLRNWALPVCGPEGCLTFYPWQADEPLAANRFGIPEPERRQRPISPAASSLVLAPSLAIDPTGIRLGYGGGYYDRFLAAHPQACSLGVLWDDFCLQEPLPRESWDIPLPFAATEKRIIQFSNPL